MTSLSVKKQLAIGLGALAVLVLVVSLLGLQALRSSTDRFEAYVAGPAQRAHLVSELSIFADRRALGVRDMVLAGTASDRSSARDAAERAQAELQTTLKALNDNVARASDVTERDREMVARIAELESRYGPVALNIVELAASGNDQAAQDMMNTRCRPLLASLLAAASDYMDYSLKQADHAVAENGNAYQSQRALLLAVALAAAAAGLLLTWAITRRLVRALGAEPATLRDVAQRVAGGNLERVEGADRAPAGSVLASMAVMQEQLVGLIGQVRESADRIAGASAEIAQGNGDLSARTEEQASALQQTAASMEQLSATVRLNADNARRADELAHGASAVAQKGGDVVTQVVQTMQAIDDSSRQIADIIGVIDSIAFQTNILALNAAVEAARAGEQGRGFAVVAAEVRGLAGRSADAAKAIKALIGASVERVEQGSALVARAGSTMADIVGSIDNVTRLIGEISAAGQQQSAGLGQVSEAVGQIDHMTQQNAALVEQSAAAAESLRAQAGQLVQAVAVFKLSAPAADHLVGVPGRPPLTAPGDGHPQGHRRGYVTAIARSEPRRPATGDAEGLVVPLKTGTHH